MKEFKIIKKKRGWNLKIINIPPLDEKLTEFVGIVLGDGNIHQHQSTNGTSYMVRISGDSIKDKEYLENYVAKLGENLFNIKAKFYLHKDHNELMVLFVGRLVVEFMIHIGLKPGNKIQSQTTIPKWIWKSDELLKACIRGLIDTDGSVYELLPNWPGLFQLTFENRNITLLRDLRKAFLKLGYNISKICGNRTEHGTKFYITRKADIKKFYKEICFSNPKHKRKLDALYSPVV